MARKNLNQIVLGAGNTDDIEISGGFYRPALASIVAAGTTTADAYVISNAAYAQIATCASGAGVRYLTLGGGTHRGLHNSGAYLCNVYPPTSGTINGATADLPYGLSVGCTAMFYTAAKDTLYGGVFSHSGNTKAEGSL
jgi:hypothetical protein